MREMQSQVYQWITETIWRLVDFVLNKSISISNKTRIVIRINAKTIGLRGMNREAIVLIIESNLIQVVNRDLP
jgi:hypothetical protein